MSLNEQVSAERVHIGFFGMRNAGKSSLVNAVTGQELSLVSDVKGTTTDPVRKAMELLPLGPVVIIDTPGVDDEGELGIMRAQRAKEMLDKIHIAVLVIDIAKGVSSYDSELISIFKEKRLPYIVAYNKSDLYEDGIEVKDNEICVSAKEKKNIDELKNKIATLVKNAEMEKRELLPDFIKEGDVVVLVTPIDSSAPKGRLILPQQQTIRAILDRGAVALVTKETELQKTLLSLKEAPRLVITDSQAFGIVNKITPPDVLLTSFSILFARYKGDIEELLKGATALDSLADNDTVLISEGCTHHRQCGDIGRDKIPALIRKMSGRELSFEFTSGGEFPSELSKYKLCVHCGGCMLNEMEMRARIEKSKGASLPITNYGMTIAHANGILKRSLSPFPELQKMLK